MSVPVSWSSPPRSRARHLGCLVALFGAALFAGCGGSDGPSAADATKSLVSSYSDLGVPVSDAEVKCLTDKVTPRLKGDDLKATAISDLSQETRVLVAGDVEACYSKENVAALIPKVVAKEAGLTEAATACIAKEFDGTVSYSALIRQEREAVDAIAKLARKCASAQ